MGLPPSEQRLLAAPGDRESCRKGPLKGPDPYCLTLDLGPWTLDLGPLDLWTFGPLDLWTFGLYGVTSAKTKMPIIRKVRAILKTMPSQVAMPTLRARMRSRS